MLPVSRNYFDLKKCFSENSEMSVSTYEMLYGKIIDTDCEVLSSSVNKSEIKDEIPEITDFEII